MNCNELKRHILNSLIRPEYFYIPVKEHEIPSGSTIRLKFDYDTGGDIYISSLYISYNTYSFMHDNYQNESGSWISVYDQNYKGYAFESDTGWRFPVSDPSQWEIYPLPDFSTMDISVTNGTVSKYSTSLSISFSEPQSLVEISGLPPGVYYISPTRPSNVISWNYFPTYYNNYDSSHYISHSSGYGMIDRNGKFSGFAYTSVYNTESPYQQTGYDMYCSTVKFANNTMPVIGAKMLNIRWVISLESIPGFTGTTLETEKGSSLAYYQRGTTGTVRGISYNSHTETYQKCYVAKLYVENVYKGKVLLGAINFRVYRSSPSVYEETGRREYYGITDILYQRAALPPTYYMTGGPIQASYEISYEGSYYLNITEEDIENSTHGTNLGTYTWVENCSPSTASPIGDTGAAFIYKETGIPTNINFVSASKNGSRIQTSATYYLKRTYTGYPVISTPRTDGGTDVSPGELTSYVKENGPYGASLSVYPSSVNSYVQNYEEWTGTLPTDGNTHNYYYMEGMTKDEFAFYVSQFSYSGTTVEAEEV